MPPPVLLAQARKFSMPDDASVSSFDLSKKDSLDPTSPVVQEPGISRIFTDAALFEQVISTCPEVLKQGFVPGDDQALQDSFKSFADLVGRDLGGDELAISGRLAQLSVNNWASDSAGLVPEHLDDSDDSADTFSVTSPDDSETEGDPPLLVRQDSIIPSVSNLEPEEIVDLLEQEFGALAPAGEEKLLLETDATLFQDVVILGTVHLTTHRLSFHASLLASTPDIAQQVLRSGPVLIHRKGWHRKRRVWLELTHDMISTYRSSSQNDKIKPLRTILLSSVDEVKPVEAKHPRHLHLVLGGIPGTTEAVTEFDTEESARAWRRELNGAIYMYRRNRRAVFNNDPADDVNGIRINIPLSRIDTVTQSSCLTFASLISVSFGTSAEAVASAGGPLSPGSEAPSRTQTPSSLTRTETSHDTTSESSLDKQTLQIAVLQKDPVWDELLSKAQKAREDAKKETTAWPGTKVYIDLDPRACVQAKQDGRGSLSELQRSISGTLALDPTADMYIAKAHIHRRLVQYMGHFAVNIECIGFYSRTFNKDIRYRVPISLVKNVKPKENTREHAAVFQVSGHKNLTVAFSSDKLRDEAVAKVKSFIDAAYERRTTSSSPTSMSPVQGLTPASSRSSSPTTARRQQSVHSPGGPASPSAEITGEERDVIAPVPKRSTTSILAPLSRIPSTVANTHLPYSMKTFLPKAINVPRAALLDMPSKHFVCLTIGSRGDVQPYIALGLGLMKQGHKVTIVTHQEYHEWIVGFGINHREAGGDPGALMKLSVENKMFSPQFFKESIGKFRQWLDDLFVDSYEQCKDADVLLESPSVMAGVHIAEALHIPYFRTFTMPWTKTREFPHAFLSPPVDAPTFNAASYVLFDNVLWTATSGQVNRWRKHTMHIGPTDMGHLAQSKIPFIYNFSQAVVPKPLDWGDATTISGYWFLDNPDLGWTPPESLIAWMDKARKDQKPIVYIGFGSIVVPNPKLVTDHLIKAVQRSGVRAIISKGWSARMAKPGEEDDTVFPDECYPLEKVPHDWLFPKIDAAMHHGGAGTTGASLRAGIPTLIRPWFGDQFFWASRVQKLGVGVKVTSLRVAEIADALTKATTDRIMKERALAVGERIREENGVETAIEAIYTYMHRAAQDRKHLH
ncbi:glycosyltransferase family 1 protein [Auriscalpium vulgare]|uniref:Glycosyltransferase family 1 protein n=1 Tax=Auriscalpium vulgare TaxID=40419 RepID=A0ACB8S4U9_9AGAM|nr:glycosyltransferase family 1 protein [Auriscalpium vulgare]